MVHAIKLVAATLATTISLITYIPYLIDMFKGKNRPHLYTWVSIFLVTSVVAYIQLVGGAGIGAIPTILGAGVDAVILFFCFKFGTQDVVLMDKVCLAITVLGVIVYAIFNSRPVFPLAVVTAAEIISFIPTFRKTRNDPYSESLPSYYFLIAKLSLILIALQEYNLLTVSYSAVWLVVIGAFLASVYAWRHGKREPKHEAPEVSPNALS